MGIQIGLATPADDVHIRGLLREPVPGRIAISYEREPEFSTGCDATGENATVLVARDLDTGATAAVACRSEREVFVNAAPIRLGYLGQLRIDRRYRGRWLVSRGFSMLKQLHDRRPLPGYLAAVTVDNREAEPLEEMIGDGEGVITPLPVDAGQLGRCQFAVGASGVRMEVGLPELPWLVKREILHRS